MTKALDYLFDLHSQANAGQRAGLTSVCSAHPMVIEAALIEAMETNSFACIEATCNQVNQDGGYTGMTPAAFHDFVMSIAQKLGFPMDRIVLGGDHLGPNPWRKMPVSEAMAKAIAMTRQYAAAGFGKIHLDASMSCADDPVPLPVPIVAERAAALAKAAEEGAKSGGHPGPAYIVGTEVPVPGGASEELETVEVSRTHDAADTIEHHRIAFAELGLDGAFKRIVGLVVQPGVEFGHTNVIAFLPEAAEPLSAWRQGVGSVVFEAHSTDYQTGDALADLVDGGFCILKVGPGLTFALREAFYGLDQIAGVLAADYEAGSLPRAMEQVMLAMPDDWNAYYHGSETSQFMQRHFSYSDRIRYYWTHKAANLAVDRLFAGLEGMDLPEPLISQFLLRQYADVVAGRVKPDARSLAIAAIRSALAPYTAACG